MSAEPIVFPLRSRALPSCRHGFIANCPACSYNAPESVMVGREIESYAVLLGGVHCDCSHYCPNWPNCKGGRFAPPQA